ncbi:MAG: DUF4131 domain-containing protein [Gammaproteobacteria bacterium]|nr:DUF4131 domain-containing protein [Gammaproteobacteria bacterium]
MLYVTAVWCLDQRWVPAAGWWLAGLIFANGHCFVAEQQRVREAHARVLSGCIVSEVTSQAGVSKFDFAAYGSTIWPGTTRYRVSWYAPTAEVDAGSCWQLALRLKPPRGSLNAVGLDYERWLFARGFAGIATVKNLPFNHKLESGRCTPG